MDKLLSPLQRVLKADERMARAHRPPPGDPPPWRKTGQTWQEWSADRAKTAKGVPNQD
jgi:hypothetical protein